MRKLAEWEDLVAWMRVVLDFDDLLAALGKLYADYLREVGGNPDRAEVRFTLVSEFQRDYEKFLHSLGESLSSQQGDENVERLLDSLYCARLQEKKAILDLVSAFHQQMQTYFPKFYEIPRSPIRLAISCSAATFPFFEHWRMMEEAQDPLWINLVSQGQVRAGLQAVPALLQATQLRPKSALHNLAEVARVSESLAKVRMGDKKDKDYGTYCRLKENFLPFGLSYQGLLTLAKILGD
ncbi:MAG: hypothetical protein H5T64_13150 [Chloroflexi bacterium]|nr:hypothetical protein [Chloroflexota bacterium]